jgi:glucokinase
VKAGVSRVTNLPWVVSEAELKGRYGWEQVRLINDLAATAVAVPLLTESELYLVNRGRPEPGGPFGLVAPGTGLGMALAIMVEGKVRAIASEGGHVDFAARNDEEMDLLKHLLRTMQRVSVERLASGPALFTIYSWLREYRNHTEPAWLAERMNSADPSKVISEVALENAEPLCVEALDLFVSIIGAAAGNLALTGMTTGGIYLGGGIPPKILPKLVDGTFVEAFTAKGRFQDFLADVPVHVILNDKAALLGAAAYAFGQAA